MNSELMAIQTGTSREPIGTAVLAQLADLDVKSISPGTARTLLHIRFDRPYLERADVLSEKARQGRLMSAEQDELDQIIRVADLVALLQSKARQALKNADRSS